MTISCTALHVPYLVCFPSMAGQHGPPSSPYMDGPMRAPMPGNMPRPPYMPGSPHRGGSPMMTRPPVHSPGAPPHSMGPPPHNMRSPSASPIPRSPLGPHMLHGGMEGRSNPSSPGSHPASPAPPQGGIPPIGAPSGGGRSTHGSPRSHSPRAAVTNNLPYSKNSLTSDQHQVS